MIVYVVTREINEYDQDGEYFEAVFMTRDIAEASIKHEGRKDYEETWYNIHEVEVHTAPTENFI